MFGLSFLSFPARIGSFATFGSLMAVSAFAQSSGMSFSVYNNTSVYNSTLTLDGDVLDNSWGCSHSGYLTTARLYSPSGRSALSQSAGLSAGVSLPLNAEYGDFTAVTSISYTCSCMYYTTQSFTDSDTVQPKVPKNVQTAGTDYYKYVSLGNYLRRRTWQVLDQTGAALARGGMSVAEQFSYGATNTCNLTVGTGSTSTN